MSINVQSQTGRTDNDQNILTERSTITHTTPNDYESLVQHDCNVPPRDTAAYKYTTHFTERLQQKHRFIYPTYVNTIIKHGQIRYSTSDGWRIVHTVAGVDMILVIDCETETPVIITGYTRISDWNTAINSEKWSETECNIMYISEKLSNETARSKHRIINEATIDQQAHIFGHKLVTKDNKSVLTCEQCGKTGTTKEAFVNSECENNN